MKPFRISGLLTIMQANMCLLFIALFAIYWVHNAWEARTTAQLKQRQADYQQRLYANQLSVIAALSQRLDGYVLDSKVDGVEPIQGIGLRGSWPLNQWLLKLEEIQQLLWLTPKEFDWRKDENNPELWQGDLSWQIHRPAILKPEQNWLPIQMDVLPSYRGTLLSVLHGARSAALLSIANTEQWVHEGTWFAKMGVTVEQIKEQSVILRSATGERATLSINEAMPSLWVPTREDNE